MRETQNYTYVDTKLRDNIYIYIYIYIYLEEKGVKETLEPIVPVVHLKEKEHVTIVSGD